jgi:hypothetical protein
MAKDDVVIGLGRPMYGTSVLLSKKKAYPSVVTTLVQMHPLTRKFMAMSNFLCTSPQMSKKLQSGFLQKFCSDTKTSAEDNGMDLSMDVKKMLHFQIKNMLEFYVVGISLGTAWAHPSSGDTVASVMIGGLRTVMVSRNKVLISWHARG